MVVYLPIAFIKDCICTMIRKRSCKNGRSAAISSGSPAGVSSPLKRIGVHKIFELELEGPLNRKDSEVDLSSQEEGMPLVAKHSDDADMLKPHKEHTNREVAAYGFYIAPIWFITEVSNSCVWFLQHLFHLRLFSSV